MLSVKRKAPEEIKNENDDVIEFKEKRKSRSIVRMIVESSNPASFVIDRYFKNQMNPFDLMEQWITSSSKKHNKERRDALISFYESKRSQLKARILFTHGHETRILVYEDVLQYLDTKKPVLSVVDGENITTTVELTVDENTGVLSGFTCYASPNKRGECLPKYVCSYVSKDSKAQKELKHREVSVIGISNRFSLCTSIEEKKERDGTKMLKALYIWKHQDTEILKHEKGLKNKEILIQKTESKHHNRLIETRGIKMKSFRYDMQCISSLVKVVRNARRRKLIWIKKVLISKGMYEDGLRRKILSFLYE
jgi:hypothetical protein